MSRLTKWKIEKAKVKVVFRLQFHATQIPQNGWEKLFISFIPTETGKATAKTSKANARGGSCKWADPIYETTRLLFDSKTKQYDDKLYKLVVGMGTSRSSILGEATINLADYADASQPSIIDLPLQASVHGTILHVTVQLLTAKTGFREFEQQRDKGLQSGNNVNKETENSTAKSASSELQIPDDLVNKARTRIQLREETNMHGEYSDSQVTCDESSTTSDNYYYVDKHDSPAGGSDHAKLVDDVASVYEENCRLRASLAVAESSISELNQELTTLQNHATEMGTETQKLAHELTTEIASGQELVKQVNYLKLECSKLKNDVQTLKETKSNSMVANKHVEDLKNETIGEIAKDEKENLVKKMHQMEFDYESHVHELEENQKRILNEMNNLSSVNNELQKRVTVSESALKRARLNYSIAVSQLQKDLDMLSFQVLSMFETNQTVIKEAFCDTSQTLSNHLSDDLKKSLSIQENIYKKVEEELGEMCCANLQLNVYSETLEETLYEARNYIRQLNEKLRQLEVSNQSLDVLFQENAYYLAKCNNLQLQNQMLESDLGNISNENYLLMEKISECEALLTEDRVYKGKHEVVCAEKLEIEKLLEAEVYDKQNLQKEIETLRSEIDDVKMKFKKMLIVEIPNSSFEKVLLRIDSVSKMFKNSFESGERHVENSEVMLNYLSTLELELQKIMSEDKSFHEQIIGLESVAEEFEKKNQDLMICVGNMCEERDKLKECLDVERGMKIKLEARCLEIEERYNEDNINLAKEVESFKLKLEDSIAQNAEILNSNEVLKTTLEDMLTKSKAEVEQLKDLQIKLDDTESRLNACLKNETFYLEENTTLASELESLKFESSQLQELLTKSKDEVACYSEENRKLVTEIESLRLELQAKNSESENEVGQLKEMLTKSKEEVARYIEENKNLETQIESLRLELQAKNSESEIEHGQLKEMLTKSKEEVARYILENKNLETQIESLRLELQACVAKNAEILESKSVHALEASRMKESLTKSKEEVARYIEENRILVTEIESLRLEFRGSVSKNAEIAESNLKVDQLEEMLTKSKEELARYIEVNNKLATEIESVRLELQVFAAKNAEHLESKSVHALEASQLKESLTKSKEEVARYIEVNKKLATEIESLRLEFQVSVAKNAEIAESNLKVDQLEEMLTKSKEEVTRYIEVNKKLATEIESVRLELQVFAAKNAEHLESKSVHALEVSQLKEVLTKSKSEIARYIEVNKNLTAEVESLKLKIENKTAHNAETKLTEVNYQNALVEDDMLISVEESNIALLVFKEKLEEQNDELIMLQNNCNQLRNNLSEQILKTEEFKNLSIYLKELKGDADVAQDKNEKEKEPTESLRMAFVKEQYLNKNQELKQQLSVSKKHSEEMLFKLQDALDEIESRKKSEASQLRRIQELEAEGESDNRDYDRLHAELECAVLSLECCKEEKEKLVCLLQESEDEKLKIVDQLSLIREKLAQKEENGSVNGKEIQGLIERSYEDEENSLVDDSKQLTVANEQFRTQHLISCIEQLDEELEKMKIDNSLIPLTNYDPGLQDSQQELAQLHEANEKLGRIYPKFFDLSGNGNALERVLALEIELAETLGTKKKSNIQFQSSFLKQHSDEEAVFKSFRDINELIKDMLEIKGKYVIVENELKEMHDRYSQLSLQFAEVEGERQKLMMTLKNVRSSRNLLRLNRSSMAALGDQTL